MLLPLSAAAIVTLALLWELALPHLRTAVGRVGSAVDAHRRARHAVAPPIDDPGRRLRAEQRARALLRSCVNEEEWAMYRDLGFLRVWASGGAGDGAAHGDVPHAYLLYPHEPIVAHVPQTGALLGEYCVAFPDRGGADDDAHNGGASTDETVGRPVGARDTRLPDADDVLAKWMALHADERRLLAEANMHLPGHRVDAARIREDLARLRRWERERLARREPAVWRGRGVRATRASNSVRAA